MAVIEGHAEHVMDAVAPDLLPSLPKLRAALDRRRRSQSGLSRLVARLLGLELKLRQYEQGKFFCDAIVRARGPEALRQVFSSPEALPTLAELRQPSAWLARTMPPALGERVSARARRAATRRARRAARAPAVGEAQPRADHEVLDRARASTSPGNCNEGPAMVYKHMFGLSGQGCRRHLISLN